MTSAKHTPEAAEKCSARIVRETELRKAGSLAKCIHCGKEVRLRRPVNGHHGWVQFPSHRAAIAKSRNPD